MIESRGQVYKKQEAEPDETDLMMLKETEEDPDCRESVSAEGAVREPGLQDPYFYIFPTNPLYFLRLNSMIILCKLRKYTKGGSKGYEDL